MNKKQKEVELAKLRDEKKVLDALKKQYEEAAEEVQAKIRLHDDRIKVDMNGLKSLDELDEDTRSIVQSQIYQKKFQQQLETQIDETVKKLNAGQYDSIEAYLKDTYTTAATGTAYDLHDQGVPLIMPIDKKTMVKTVELDPKLSQKLYGSYMEQMKDNIRGEISRGIAMADSYEHIARNISNKTNQSFNKTMRIVRTEGHRIQIESAFEQQQKAKKAGADIVKQWDSTLDGRTRPSHRKLDGQIREIDDYFEVNGHKAKHPAGFGRPEEDINCRCALLQRAKWALDDEELETLKKRAEYYGLDKTDNFNDFQKKYLKATEVVMAKEAVGSATDIEELNDALKKHTGYTNIDLSEIDFDLAQENAEQWATLHEEYNTSTVDIHTGKLGKGIYAEAFRTGQDKACVVTMDKWSFREKEKHINQFKKDVASGYHPAGIPDNKMAVAVMTHEFAHTLSSSMQAHDEDFWKEIKKIKKKYASKLTSIDKRYIVLNELTYAEAQAEKAKIMISEYAHKNADEFLAEAFSMAKLSETPSPFAMEVLTVVDKYFRKTSATNVAKTIDKTGKSAIISSKAKAKKTLDGVIEAYSRQTDKALQSGIRSELKQIEKHLDKIEHPEKYVTDWETRNEYYKQGLLDKWRKEIDNFKLQVKLREDELARREKGE